MTNSALDKLAEELGVDKYAPKEPINDKSLFGVDNHQDIKVDKSKHTDIMTDEEWHKKKMPLPAFYNSHK